MALITTHSNTARAHTHTIKPTTTTTKRTTTTSTASFSSSFLCLALLLLHLHVCKPRGVPPTSGLWEAQALLREVDLPFASCCVCTSHWPQAFHLIRISVLHGSSPLSLVRLMGGSVFASRSHAQADFMCKSLHCASLSPPLSLPSPLGRPALPPAAPAFSAARLAAHPFPPVEGVQVFVN